MATATKSNLSTRARSSDITTKVTIKKDDYYEKWRPPPGIRYNLSETNINLDAILPRVKLKYTTVNYDPGQDLSVPDTTHTQKYAKPRARGPVFIYEEEIEAKLWKERQIQVLEEFLRETKIRHRLNRQQIKGLHNEIIYFIGPEWYHELSPKQMQSADELKSAMAVDHRFHTIINTQETLGSMGLVWWPNHTKVAYALKKFFRCPVEFLLTLVRLNRPKTPQKKTKYTLNDKIMLSAVVHLSIRETFRELHLRVPSPPRSQEKDQIDPSKDHFPSRRPNLSKGNRKHSSPYLRRMTPVVQKHTKEVYMNRHKEWPYLEYFDYVDDMYDVKWIKMPSSPQRRGRTEEKEPTKWNQPPKIPVRLIKRQIKQRKIYELKKPTPYISPCKMKAVIEEVEDKETPQDIIINTNIDLDNICCCSPSSFNENTTFDLKIRITTSDEELNLIQKLCPYNPNNAIGDLKLVKQKKIDGSRGTSRGSQPEDKPIKKIEYSCECCTCGKTINICPELGSAAKTLGDLKKLKEQLPIETKTKETEKSVEKKVKKPDIIKEEKSKTIKDKKAKPVKIDLKSKDKSTKSTKSKVTKSQKDNTSIKSTSSMKKTKMAGKLSKTKTKPDLEVAIPEVAKPKVVEPKPEEKIEIKDVPVEVKVEEKPIEAVKSETKQDDEKCITEIKPAIKTTKSGRPIDDQCTCLSYSSSSSSSTDIDDPFYLCTCKASSDSCVCCTCGELDPEFLLKVRRFNEIHNTDHRPCTCDCKCQSKKACCCGGNTEKPCKYCFCTMKQRREAERLRLLAEEEERRRLKELEDLRRIQEEQDRLKQLEKKEEPPASPRTSQKLSLKQLRRLSAKHIKRKSQSSSSKVTTPSSKKSARKYDINTLRRLSAKHEKRKSSSDSGKRKVSTEIPEVIDKGKVCKCDKIYAQYLDAHESCMSLFSHYQKKIEQDIKDYLEDIKTNKCLCGDSDESSEKEMNEQQKHDYLKSLLTAAADAETCKCDEPKPNPCTCGCTGDLAHPFAACTCGVDHAGCTCNQTISSTSDSNESLSDDDCCYNCKQGPCTCGQFLKKRSCPMDTDNIDDYDDSDDSSDSDEDNICSCNTDPCCCTCGDDKPCKCRKFIEKVKKMRAAAKASKEQTETETQSSSKIQKSGSSGDKKSTLHTYEGYEALPVQDDLDDEETERIEEIDPRIFVLDKFPKSKIKQQQLLRAVLNALADDGYPLAKLPDVHRLPHFKVWLNKRCGKYIPITDRDKYMKMSVDFWNHIAICPGTPARNPQIPIPKKLLHTATWAKVLKYRRMIETVLTDFRRNVKHKYIDKAQEFFPTTYPYQFYTKSFRNCFFSYLPADENHLFVFKPWMLNEKKDMSSRKPC